eukprot:6457066-Amphidinium_carterae.2
MDNDHTNGLLKTTGKTYFQPPGEAHDTQSGLRVSFWKITVEPVDPGSTSPVSRLPGDTLLAEGIRPPVASPASGMPLELAVSVAAGAKPVGLFLTHLYLELSAS